LKIRTAFPHILGRKYPVVKPEYPVLTVLYLLRMQDVAAVPLLGRTGEPRALFGFSSLSRLLALPPGRFAAFLAEPCGNASEKLESVGADDDLESLLEAFEDRRLGVACIKGDGPDERSLVTLGDVLELFSKNWLRASATLEEVASPVFSVPTDTTIRKGIEEMFSRRIRRLFLAKGSYVSDRSIMDRVFSPLVLDSVAADPATDVLAAPLGSLRKDAPLRVRPGTAFKAAAAKLRGEGLQCLLVDGGVVTQWDLVMKPWMSGSLSIR
jgi:CBS domain-containing protein